MIKGAGSDYTLTYIGRDADLAAFAFATSATFTVAVGSVYMMAFSTFLGSAGGGVAFLPNPVIIATDRGENLVDTVNNQRVTAYMSVSPTGAEALKPTDLLSVQFFNGIATFQQLYINQTGSPYKVSFLSDMVSYVCNVYI